MAVNGRGRTKFRALNEKRVKEGAQRTNSKYDSIFQQGVKTLKMKQGVNNLRVVRGSDQEYWGETVWVHSYIGIKKSTYLCPYKMGKSKKCSVCDAAAEALSAGDKEEAKALDARERVIAYVINRDDEKEGLQVWDQSWNSAHDLDAVCDTKRGVLDISHPEAGFDISIIRQGQGLNTRYSGLNVDREATPLSESSRQQDAWIEEIDQKPLLSLLRYYDDDYLRDILSGKVEEKDEDEDESADDKRALRSNGRDRDEDEADARDRGEGDEEDRPMRGRGRDKDSAPWEDEEDDTRPAKRTRAKPDDEPDDADGEGAEARRWRNGKGSSSKDDEKPASRRARDDREEEDERPTRRGRDSEDDDRDDRRGARGRSRDEEDDDKPRSRRREAASERDEEDEERPARRSRADDDDDKPRSRARNDDDEDEKPRSRERVRTRSDDDDEEPRSRRR